MIPLEADEVVAMGRFLAGARSRGESLWRTFWKGGTVKGGGPDERSPDLMDLPRDFGKVFRASTWRMSMPWTLVVPALLGVLRKLG